MAGETSLTLDRESAKRQDSGMSGMDPTIPEAAAPKTKSFASTIATGKRMNSNEKHDTTKTSKTPNVLGVNRNKGNAQRRDHSMLRRVKNMALAPLEFGKGKS